MTKKLDENNTQVEVIMDPELNKQLDDQAVEITKNIVDSIQLTEDEKDELAKDEGLGLQLEFDQFLNDKVEIDNTDGGEFGKVKTGIDLIDHLSGGGFNLGGFTMIVGMPGSFKSTLLAQIIGYNQKLYGKNMLCVYFDTEASMTTKRLAQLGAGNPPIKPYDDVTIEKVFKTIEAMCAERDTDNINSTMGLKQKLLSQLLPRYLSKLKKYNISLIGINQLRDRLNVGMYAPAPDLMHTANFEIPGGKAVKFNASHLLKLQNRGELDVSKYEFSGVRVEIEFLKNKSFTPFIKAPIIIDFKKGVSNFWTNYTLLTDNSRLKTGAWNYLTDMPEKKFRTKDAITLYNTDARFKELFDNNVQEVLKSVFKED